MQNPLLAFAAFALLTAMVAPPATASSCESLASLTLPKTTITMARSVAAGDFDAPPGAGPPGAGGLRDLPAFCRVAATLAPTADSDIKIEIWMPASGWNGKFQAVGNGGWAGAITYGALAMALRRGYATASTDTGHRGGSGSFALGHPEKLIDFAYRAVHEMTVKSKAVIAAFYGDGPKFSYWNGCSTGGKQGLAEAQRYPADFDGIIAGAPAINMMRLHAGSLWVAQAVHKDRDSFIPQSKFPLIHNAAVEACDALDGVKDGLLEDPTRCHFDPKALECKDGDAPTCLTPAQVEAARKIYAGAKNPRTGREVYPPFEPGSEFGWGGLAGMQPLPIANDTFKYVVFEDANWDYRTLNFDGDVARADKVDNGTNSATDPNLKPLVERGGKLILYHGWSDPAIAPLNTINYYKSVVDALGGARKTAESARLFLAPGMGHCRGGEGPDTFDVVGAMEQWVEHGKAPDRIVASHGRNARVDRTRPLCPYPQVAQYKGSGSIDDAANFVCKAPPAP